MGHDPKLPDYHVLNFFYDDDDACALTALVHNDRYHVIVESPRLTSRSATGKKHLQEYTQLLGAIKRKEKHEAEDENDKEQTVSTKPESDEQSICTHDSGISISADEKSDCTHTTQHAPTKDPRTALYNWILTPLLPLFPSPPNANQQRTVQEWYFCKTHFYHLSLDSTSHLVAKEEPPSSTLLFRMESLLPTLSLPKYILNLSIPLISASDLTILSTSTDPAPIHPTLVKNTSPHSPSTGPYFLKVVDPSQPGPTKREIRIMKSIESKGLHEHIRMPLIRGLVTFSLSSLNPENDTRGARKGTEIMGFLMDPISDPTPLTHLLDAEIAQERREKWAEESERMVKVLHENGIVWGDAKGDNFMVDKEDRLWIIDFGGSYTPGWVDEELKETVEGDEQGIAKVVNGLKDPVNYTIGDEDEEVETEGEKEVEQEEGGKRGGGEKEEGRRGKKRKAEELEREEEVEDEEGGRRVKQQRRDGRREKDGICVCKGPEEGAMIACDGEECTIEWFHMSCLGLEKAPKGEWFCKECTPT